MGSQLEVPMVTFVSLQPTISPSGLTTRVERRESDRTKAPVQAQKTLSKTSMQQENLATSTTAVPRRTHDTATNVLPSREVEKSEHGHFIVRALQMLPMLRARMEV